VDDAEAGTVRLGGIWSSINCHECPRLHTLDRFLWPLLGSVRTICVHRPWTRVSNTGVILDTRVYGPCLRASVHTTRYHGPWTRLVRSELPWTRPVLTGRVHACVHRHLLTTVNTGRGDWPWICAFHKLARKICHMRRKISSEFCVPKSIEISSFLTEIFDKEEGVITQSGKEVWYTGPWRVGFCVRYSYHHGLGRWIPAHATHRWTRCNVPCNNHDCTDFMYTRWSDVTVICGHIYLVGQHGVLCAVNWWRFVALFE